MARRDRLTDLKTSAPGLALLVPLALSGPPAAAQGLGQKDHGGEVYRSAYFLGRGDTGIAVADEEEAIFYNPAGIAQGKGIYKKTVLASPHLEVSSATRDLARRLAAENADAVETVRENVGRPNHFGASNFTGLIFRRAALGAVATSNANLLAYKSPEQGGLEVVEATADQTAGLTFSLAESFWKNRLLLGVTGKYLMRGKGELSASAAESSAIQDKLDDQSEFLGTGQGGGADLGLMLLGGGPRLRLAFGLTVADVGDTRIAPSEETQLDLDLKQTINAGLSIEPGTKFSRLKMLVDYRDIAGRAIANPLKRLHLGSELSVLDAVGVTGGLNQGYPTGGLYFDLYVLRLDLGFYTEEISERVGARPDTRYFLRLKLGF